MRNLLKELKEHGIKLSTSAHDDGVTYTLTSRVIDSAMYELTFWLKNEESPESRIDNVKKWIKEKSL